jgi:excisionase family DNA binding protein
VEDKITFTVDQIGKRTGLSRTFLYAEVKAGRLRSLKVGKHRLIHIDDETDYLAAHRQPPLAA